MSIGTLDGDYAPFVEQYLNPMSVSGREVMCVCVFHDDTNASMQFNLDRGLFVCFSCGVGGSIRKIERRLGVDHKNIEVGLDVIYRKLKDLNNTDSGPVIMSESQLALYRIPSEHWKARGITDDIVDAFDLGYDVMNDAMTIPVRDMAGNLLGVTRRYCEDDPPMRYRYPKGFHKAENLFGSWLVAADDSATTVVLTEGAIDTMTLWQWGVPAMAVYGSAVSEAQIRIMRRLGLLKIVLFFDNDSAGIKLTKRCHGFEQQRDGSWKRHREQDLRRYFDVTVVDWRGVPKHVAKDVNDLERKGNRRQGERMLALAHSLG